MSGHTRGAGDSARGGGARDSARDGRARDSARGGRAGKSARGDGTRALALVALALLGACRMQEREKGVDADSARAPAHAVEAYACTLIGVPELQRITGETLAAGPRTEDYQGYSRCDWTRGGTAFLALVVNEHGSFEAYRTVPGAEPVQQLGRAAVWNPRTQQLGARAPRGTISVNFLATPFQKAWAERIARAVLARMPADSGAPAATPRPAGTPADSGIH